MISASTFARRWRLASGIQQCKLSTTVADVIGASCSGIAGLGLGGGVSTTTRTG